jgi:Sec-independent protein translocase protein TatA
MNIGIGQILVIVFIFIIFFGNFSSITKNTTLAIKMLKDVINK